MADAQKSKQRSNPVNLIIGLVGLVLFLIGLIGRVQRWEMVAIPFEGIGASVMASALVAWLFYKQSADPVVDALEKLHREHVVLQRCQDAGISDIIAERDMIPPEETLEWIRRATSRIYLLTVARQNWLMNPELPKLLKTKASTCKVRILLVQPDSPLTNLWEEKERVSGTSSKQVSEVARDVLARLRPIADDLKENGGGLKTLSQVHHIPFCSILMVDDEMRITPYLYHLEGGLCPAFTLRDSGPLWRRYVDDFEILYKKGSLVRGSEQFLDSGEKTRIAKKGMIEKRLARRTEEDEATLYDS